MEIVTQLSRTHYSYFFFFAFCVNVSLIVMSLSTSPTRLDGLSELHDKKAGGVFAQKHV